MSRKAATDLAYLHEELEKLHKDLLEQVSEEGPNPHNASLGSAALGLESALTKVALVLKSQSEEGEGE